MNLVLSNARPAPWRPELTESVLKWKFGMLVLGHDLRPQATLCMIL